MTRLLFLGPLLLAGAATAQAQVHKCPGPDGKLTYSQAPCATAGGAQMTPSQLRGNAPRAARSPASAASATSPAAPSNRQ